MSILSSREHSCVNPRLAKESNKNDKCRDLRQDSEFTVHYILQATLPYMEVQLGQCRVVSKDLVGVRSSHTE